MSQANRGNCCLVNQPFITGKGPRRSFVSCTAHRMKTSSSAHHCPPPGIIIPTDDDVLFTTSPTLKRSHHGNTTFSSYVQSKCDGFAQSKNKPLYVRRCITLFKSNYPNARFLEFTTNVTSSWIIAPTALVISRTRRRFYYFAKESPGLGGDVRKLGGLQSLVWPSFGREHPSIMKLGMDILEPIFTNPTHHPFVEGRGFVIYAGAPYGNTKKISSRAGVYLRNFYGDSHSTPTNDSNTHNVVSYGTGSGRSTVGIPSR